MSIIGSARTTDRAWPRTDAHDELRLQWEFLAFLRTTALAKAAGLSPAQATETPLPTSPLMSVTGILKHLTAVERHWLTRTAGGATLPALWDPHDADAEWRLTPADTPTAVAAAYRVEWDLAESAIAGLRPDDPARADDTHTLRWVLAHVTQETARHIGHLDILRELIDGHVGE
ncbi:DinB family protein [Actinokineospora iranica]|uniref:Uncharacterized damage-inducible protein DinB (Forms a four-helix bundle) n=1 Tax=Actinokineospora iranica TaxID=1271860 RepID=A0A1G6IQQ8_9PSEU|nr:DinB family protein [Actinokineospora iranica]SDC08839.1 Uncharacterized damage-inducible protein DinB (forms a four-helix bundle) [Actinokineospora iranica]